MSWTRDKGRDRAGELIARAYERRISAVRVPHFSLRGTSAPSAEHRSHHETWSPGRVRAANLAFALFFVISFSVAGASIGRPAVFSTYLIPRVERHHLTEQLPRALSSLQNRLAAGLIGG